MADTVKKARTREKSASTEDRAQLWLAQTPQMFRAGLLVQALQRARRGHRRGRGDRAAGPQAALVAGSRENLKVTWPEDLAMAEGIRAARRE